MTPLLLGLLAWVLLAMAAWKYATIRPTLHPYDRMGAAVFFTVVGLPLFVAGLGLIVQPLVA
jgi:hypothetical protein